MYQIANCFIRCRFNSSFTWRIENQCELDSLQFNIFFYSIQYIRAESQVDRIAPPMVTWCHIQIRMPRNIFRSVAPPQLAFYVMLLESNEKTQSRYVSRTINHTRKRLNTVFLTNDAITASGGNSKSSSFFKGSF